MSFHKKIDRQIGGKPSHRAFVPPRSGAEWLVGVGFRCWLAGYDTGDIACWENGWNEYTRALGTERAKRAVTELACWVARCAPRPRARSNITRSAAPASAPTNAWRSR